MASRKAASWLTTLQGAVMAAQGAALIHTHSADLGQHFGHGLGA
jgi:hypothetical protein